uniref:Methyltransferase domain-containing protein n=1 Tax=Candidatus Kentrum sp. LFY TaxID=2126342 RepID=A0A450V1Q4_9GAMM|nr:MAG: hypothetical protein BECKLFY1418B_GA0070995_1001105 [Candidatus Kentron sp. LFY]VFJ98713.1 MAG: hypothetical protein BECKLFY1418A_GA0070994_108711 [Candidatus Kentron sp. LFY]
MGLRRPFRKMYLHYKLRSKTAEEIFTDAYEINREKKKQGKLASVSGVGSDARQTGIIAREIPVLFNEFNVSTVLDIPCGDFNWMKDVDLGGVDYIGADIVGELIRENSEKYEKQGIRFQKLNLITDKLPKVDLVFCRDCLVHLSFSDIFLALNNVCDSESRYLLTTTFQRRTGNRDIATGLWRALNLQLAPFSLPKPLEIINEATTNADGSYRNETMELGNISDIQDKTLGLWKISDIRESLKHR